MHRSGTITGLLVAALALAVPATGSAMSTPKVKLRAVGAPPSKATAPGSAFTLRGRLVNTSRATQRPKLTITLRRTKTSAARKVATKRLRRVKPGRSLRYSVRVKLPSGLATGNYYVRTCVLGACRFSSRRVKVRRPSTPKPPATTPSQPTPQAGPQNAFEVLVLGAGAAGATVDAVRDLGRQNGFGVTVAGDASGFTEANLKRYRAVILAGTSGDVLSDAQQAAFEAYFTEGGGFLAVGDAIATEPEWQFLTDVLGARAKGAAAAPAEATIKVADRGHAASRDLPLAWRHTDSYLNFDRNVRGVAHVLATVDERTYAGGTMGFDHPIAWCKDYKGGRSFYTGVNSFAGAEAGKHLEGAIEWAAGVADPVYSDCGATIVANYQQTKISAPPNLNEPIGFDVLPDGRVIQTARNGQLRLHDADKGETKVIAEIPVYTNSEDGLYGPAIDNDFATNQWVYLYYAPPTVRIRKCDGTLADVTTPTGSAPDTAADPCVWQDTWQGYFQLSRFKFVDGANPRLDLASEQKILQVPNNRGACCHVAGDIDFDTHNNLWLVTGDDTPSGGGNSGGFSPHNDQMTAGGLYNAPHVDARRSSLNTNDLRGKVLRITVKADGSYDVPAGNLFAPGTDKTRPEVYAMGFRNPFRIQVDSNDVAYVTDYSPDSATPEKFRGPPAPGAWRSSASRPTTAGRCACRRSCRTTGGTSTRTSRWTPRRPSTTAMTRRAGRRTSRAGTRASSTRRRSASPTSGTRSATTPPRRSAPRAWRPTTGPMAPARSSSPSSTRAASRRTARSSTATTPTTRARRSSRRTTTTRSSSASSARTRCARSAWTKATRSTRSTSCSTAATSRPTAARCRSSATRRWTCSSGPTARSTC